jgi:hypothetical protein
MSFSSKMKSNVAVVAVCLLAWFGWQEIGRDRWPPVSEQSSVASTTLNPLLENPDRSTKQVSILPGQQILKNYASASTRPQDDLQAMAHLFSNLRLLVKGHSPFRMGANEEFAAALLGRNSAKEVLLALPHPCFNEQGQLIDRWATPLFFHVRDVSRIDIRSAGPDQKMWTPDDLHRRYDGQFSSGETLPD